MANPSEYEVLQTNRNYTGGGGSMRLMNTLHGTVLRTRRAFAVLQAWQVDRLEQPYFLLSFLFDRAR